MIPRAAVLPQPHPLSARLSETLRHISRHLNARGFVLRKRRVYVIEQRQTRALRPLAPL